MHDEERDLRPVLARREELLDRVLRRVHGDLELVEGRRRPALDARLEDLGRVGERVERVEGDVVVDLAAQDRGRPERRQLDLANELAVFVAELDVADDVLQIPERETMPDDAHGLERRVRPLGDDLLPLVARGMRGVHAEDAVLGRTFVGPDEEAVAVDVHVVTRVDARDERPPLRLRGPQVLEVDVGARPAVLDRGDEPAAVLADTRAHERLRVARLLVDDPVLLGIGPELVQAHLGVAGAVRRGDARGAAGGSHV